MNVLVSGSHGLIGSRLVSSLRADGHQVTPLVRGSTPAQTDIAWDPQKEIIEAARLEGFQAVVHLAGESIAAGRWTEQQKQRIRDSRLASTRLLATTLSHLQRPPSVFVVASAIGYYGDRGDEVLDENSSPGHGFLPEVCQQWEAASQPARDHGIRTVNTRFGVVLAREGGALKKMLFPFKLGLGGRVGTGKQWMSWIDIDDAVAVLRWSIERNELSGPVNAVAPHAVKNAEFTKTLGRVLRRPTVFPLPAPVARLMLGEMADALLLASAHVKPLRLHESGYQFRYPQLEASLRHVLS